MIVRGIENSAVTLGELELPPTARLRVYRVNTTLNNGEMVTLAEAPAGTCKVTARAPPRAALHALIVAAPVNVSPPHLIRTPNPGMRVSIPISLSVTQYSVSPAPGEDLGPTSLTLVASLHSLRFLPHPTPLSRSHPSSYHYCGTQPAQSWGQSSTRWGTALLTSRPVCVFFRTRHLRRKTRRPSS